MKYTKFLLVVAASLFFSNLSAQNVMYQWRTHLAYNNISQVAVTKDKVYAISDGAIFSVTKSDKEIKTHSKVTGLSDNSAIFIAYSQKHGEMLVAYENGNIDFVSDNGQIVNYPDIFRANLTASKQLNDVLFDGDFAYLSYTFGIVKWSMRNMEVAETYFIGENNTFVDVKSVSILDGYFYAVAANKIYKAPISGVNLLNFANWQVLTDFPEPLIPNIKAITYNSSIYLLKDNGEVYILNNDFWQEIPAYSEVTNICTNDNTLFVISDRVVNCSKAQQPITFNESIQMAIYDSSQSKIWAAGGSSGVVLANLTARETDFGPNGPATNSFWRLRYAHGRIYAVPGGRNDVSTSDNKSGTVMIYEKNYWKNIYRGTIDAKTEQLGLKGMCFDLLDIAVSKNDKTHFYVSSFQIGIYEFRDDQPFMLYNSQQNAPSVVESISTSSQGHRVEALYLDKSSRLWFATDWLQYLKPSSPTIKFLDPDPDGTGPLLGQVTDVFYNETGGENAILVYEIVPSPLNENVKFLMIARGGFGVFAFDDRGTPYDVNDDLTRHHQNFVDKDGKSFSHTKSVICAAPDKKNNTIWVGGTFGTMVMDNLQNVFNQDYRVTRVKIPRNDGSGLADYLLENVVVRSIAIDGENRKWIGTDSEGVFLMSDDGTQTIYHFTAENSPLLSNNIRNIAINDATGEVFFATDKGLISFQSDATESPQTPFKNLHAYPNPVRPEHLAKGIPITITNIGYKDNDGNYQSTVVKIVDTAGNLVYETVTKGGMITWDGRRKGGEIVSTGVYIAICVTKDGKYHDTTKILIVN